jgi:hypothetical protein
MLLALHVAAKIAAMRVYLRGSVEPRFRCAGQAAPLLIRCRSSGNSGKGMANYRFDPAIPVI